jgi:response regulator NasT
VLEVASLQFKAYQSLRDELGRARASLAQRDIVEQAKKRLMASHRLTEPEAHKRLQRMAMDRGMKLADMANAILAKI